MRAIEPEDFYNERVPRRLRDFVRGNRRIEAALASVVSGQQVPPESILEIGCGIGFVAWRLHHRWPSAQIVGVDTSSVSIDAARRLFGDSGVRYMHGRLEGLDLHGPFDLVVMMDVYEHIEAAHRGSVHRRIDELLAVEGSVFISVPTPHYQQYLRQHKPEGLQPVDEDVAASDLEQFGYACGATMISYRQVSVWRHLDYAHCWLCRVPGAGVDVRPREDLGAWSRARRLVSKARAFGGSEEGRRANLVADRLGSEVLKAARDS